MRNHGQIILDVMFGTASVIAGVVVWGMAINSQASIAVERMLGPLGAPIGALRQVTNQVYDRSGEDN